MAQAEALTPAALDWAVPGHYSIADSYLITIYRWAFQILKDLGVRSMRLLSNNPRKLVGIEGYQLSVVEWIPLEIPASDNTRRYLKTKKDKLGHKLTSV